MILQQEDFFKIYKPFNNHFYDNADYEGCLFDTQGDEFEYVSSFKEDNCNRIWTLVTGNNPENLYILPGLHTVNREGYFLTEVCCEDSNLEINLNNLLTDNDAFNVILEYLKTTGCYINEDKIDKLIFNKI